MNDTVKRYWGKFAGSVFDNNDPKRLGRIRALVPEVGFVADPTDWAFPCASPYGGAADTGMFAVPENGMNVWMEFEAGDVNRPIWAGVFWSEPNGVPETPLVARGAPDASQLAKGTDEAVDLDGAKFAEPPTAYGAKYPHNKVLKTASGHMIELDDTPGQERIGLFHRIGSYVEIKRDGSLTQKVAGRLHQISDGDSVTHVNGKKIEIVEKDSHETVRGTTSVVREKAVDETFKAPVTRTYSGDVTETIEGHHVVDHKGTREESFHGSLEQVVGGGFAQTIGGAKSAQIVGTEKTQIGNLLAAAIAKQIDIALGDYVLNLIGPATHIDLNVNGLSGKIRLSCLSPLGKVELNVGIVPLTPMDGVVTGMSIDPFLGSPHPDHSQVVFAKHFPL